MNTKEDQIYGGEEKKNCIIQYEDLGFAKHSKNIGDLTISHYKYYQFGEYRRSSSKSGTALFFFMIYFHKLGADPWFVKGGGGLENYDK